MELPTSIPIQVAFIMLGIGAVAGLGLAIGFLPDHWVRRDKFGIFLILASIAMICAFVIPWLLEIKIKWPKVGNEEWLMLSAGAVLFLLGVTLHKIINRPTPRRWHQNPRPRNHQPGPQT